MGTSAHQLKNQNIFINLIDKQPVGTDMAFPNADIVAYQFMIMKLLRQSDPLASNSTTFLKRCMSASDFWRLLKSFLKRDVYFTSYFMS